MPTPIKASLHPGKFTRGFWHLPLQNRSWSKFLDAMARAGVTVFDPGPVLQQLQTAENVPVYLATDTHWRPEVMEIVAAELAARVSKTAPYTGPPAGYKRSTTNVENRGDIDTMLRLPPHWDLYARKIVSLHPVLTRTGTLWQPAADGEVLLLGDSHTLVFSVGGDLHTTGAGLFDQLNADLGFAVDLLGVRGSGATPSRIKLYQRTRKEPEMLATKKVVVWCLSARELTGSGGWRKIPVAKK